jgi:hypothetical protein
LIGTKLAQLFLSPSLIRIRKGDIPKCQRMEASTNQPDPWEPRPELPQAVAQAQAPALEQHFRKQRTTTVKQFLKLQTRQKTTSLTKFL